MASVKMDDDYCITTPDLKRCDAKIPSGVSLSSATSLISRRNPVGPDSKTGYNYTPITRSAQDTAELIAIYRSRIGSSGGATTKHFPAAFDGVVPFLSGANPVLLMNNPAEGSDWFNRIGEQITMHHVTIRGTVQWIVPTDVAGTPMVLNTAAAIARPVRIMIICDKMPQLATPTLNANGTTTDFIGILFNNGSGSINVDASYNFNTHGFRYQILRDETLSNPNWTAVSSTTTALGYIGHKHFEHHIDLKGMRSQTSNAASAVPDTNALYVVALLDDHSGTVGPPPIQKPNISVMTDLSFTDTAQ